jgi:Transposase
MHYCGLDVLRKSTHVCIEDAQGRRVKRTVVATTPTELARAVERYAERGLRVAIEAGNQTAWIVDLLRELGAKVHVVHPLKVKLIAESKRKTDRIHAQLLRTSCEWAGCRSRSMCPVTGAGNCGGCWSRGGSWYRCGPNCSTWCAGWRGSSGSELRPRALLTRTGWEWPMPGWRPVCALAGSGWSTGGSPSRDGVRFVQSRHGRDGRLQDRRS